MKKVLKFLVGIFAAEYLILVKFEFFTTLLKCLSPKHPEYAQHAIDVAVCIAVIANYIVTISNPEKKYERAEIARKRYLQHVAQRIINELKNKGYEVKFNVMAKKRLWSSAHLMPDNSGNSRWTLFPQIFKCVWTSSDEHHIPKNFILGIKQGTSGIAYTTGEPKILNVEGISYESAKEKMKLNQKQYEKIKHLTVLISTPIFVKKSETDSGDSIIIGILTMESSAKDLGQLLDDPKPNDPQSVRDLIKENREPFEEAIKELAETYSKLYF